MDTIESVEGLMNTPKDWIERLFGENSLEVREKARELAAWCYRDAERVVAELAELPAPAGNDRRFKTANYAAEAIARRAKEVT